MRRPAGREIVLWALALTVALEGVTVLLRFGLGLESSRDTASTVGALTGGIRIHHGYIGVLVIVGALSCLRRWPKGSRWALVIGIALLLSDAIHHFLVLWPMVGSPQFHWVYPAG